MSPDDPSLSTTQKSLYLWRTYLRKQKKLLFFAVLAGGIAAASAGFGIPVIMEKVFPIVFGTKPMPEWIRVWLESRVSPEHFDALALWVTAASLPLIMLLKGSATYINVYLLSKAGLNVLEEMRTKVFSRLQRLPLSFHDKHKSGDLLSRLVHDTQYLQEGMLAVMNDLVIQPLTLLAAFGYLAYASWGNAQVPTFLLNMLIAMACVPIVKKAGTLMLKRTGKMFAGMGDITATIQENLASQRDIRAFCLEDKQAETLRGQIKLFFSMMMKMVLWRQAITPAIEIVSAFALAFSLYVGCSDGLTVEQFGAIAIALYYCYEPIKRLGVVHNTLRMNTLMMARINEVIYAEDRMPEPENPVALGRARGEVGFNHVEFAYDADNLVLKGIDLSVPAGQIVALVGPSGSGKTTFINLLCRFYDAGEGSVTIDGVDVRQIAKAELRDTVGLVSQHPVLFHMSIRENIRLGRQSASNDEVERAARLAFVDEFALKEADGYDRMIGEGGEGLSGGQRQRVSIARAFLKNAPIMILDEATASLDMTSEAKIQESLESLTEGKTTFVIAHRFSTIRMAHRILVFDQGRIVADGPHTSLYESSALYRDLYDKQMMKQLAAETEEQEETNRELCHA